MDKLTLIILAAHEPTTMVADNDGDVWHAACLLRFVSHFRVHKTIESVLGQATVGAPSLEWCYATNCICAS